MRVNDDVHSEAVLANPTGCNEVRTKRVILGQISRKVHLLPLKDFLYVLSPRKTELSKMPPLDEVNLAVPRRLVHFVWVSAEAELDQRRKGQAIRTVVSDQERVLFTCKPTMFSRELDDSISLYGI